MNILFLSELFYPHGGGAELATHLNAKLLSEAGLNVIVVTNKFDREQDYSKSKNLTVYRLPLFKSDVSNKYSILGRVDVLFSSFMKKLVKRADVIYIPRLWYSMISAAKIFKKPVIVHVHDYTPICPLAIMYDSSKEKVCRNENVCSAQCIYKFERNKNIDFKGPFFSVCLNFLGGLVFKKFIAYADSILCVSEAQRDILIRRLPKISNKIRVIYNPLPNLSPVGINGRDFGYFGGFNLLKGFGVLYNALASLDDPAVKVHVTGLSTRALKLTKFSRAGMILHERLEYEKQLEFYKRIQGVIFPSIIPEPLPYVTAEAILRARVLIASRIGGIPEQVKGCKGVFLFDPGNYLELAAIMDHVSGLEEETISDLGLQNREVFTKNFSNKTTVDGLLRVINYVV